LAYTANGDILFIGSNAVTLAIGGKRVPGILTANQAHIADANSMIDVIRFGNTTINAVVNSSQLTLANSTVSIGLIKPTTVQIAGQYYLKADGSWSTVSAGSASPAGANTNVQYNNSGVTDGVAAFIFNNTTNNVTIANSVITGSVTQNIGGFYAGANVILDTIKLFVGNRW